jgi:hypothetical protein
VAPTPGTYTITARFEGIHFGLSSTDVPGLHNAASLFEAEIEGYRGDPAYAMEGISPTAAYSSQIDLKANHKPSRLHVGTGGTIRTSVTRPVSLPK